LRRPPDRLARPQGALEEIPALPHLLEELEEIGDAGGRPGEQPLGGRRSGAKAPPSTADVPEGLEQIEKEQHAARVGATAPVEFRGAERSRGQRLKEAEPEGDEDALGGERAVQVQDRSRTEVAVEKDQPLEGVELQRHGDPPRVAMKPSSGRSFCRRRWMSMKKRDTCMAFMCCVVRRPR
jgi:hypothetical protein